MPPRIISLLPGATEIVCALGAFDALVGVSHECDVPSEVRRLPRVTTTPIDVHASLAEIDAAVRAAGRDGVPVVAINAETLRSLKPTVIITQLLCDVCAVTDGQVISLANVLDPPPVVVTMTGRTLSGVWDDIRAVGRAIGRADAAHALAQECGDAVVALASERGMAHGPSARSRPRAVVIEWLDPLYLAGHWVPEMLYAAGLDDVGARPGDHSTPRTWSEVMALDPEVVIVGLCGFDEVRAQRELDAITDDTVRSWLAGRVVACLDGNAYTSRAGPGLVDGMRSLSRLEREG